jgi:hypothetical protein
MELQTHCAELPTDNDTNNVSKSKPFRSELSLVLSYPNDVKNAQNDENLVSTPSTAEAISYNPLLVQGLPSPYMPFPSSPLTPPMNFKTDPLERLQDYSHLPFAPLNATTPMYSSSNSLFCTVSAPSTPALDRKCIDKFCANETNAVEGRSGSDKKKAKRVSILNMTKDDSTEKGPETPVTEDGNSLAKDADKMKQNSTESSSNSNLHHSHAHKGHGHSHSHVKRRMSLDNLAVRTELIY